MTVVGHGTVATYNNWRCRCLLCTWARRLAGREKLARGRRREDIAWRAAHGLQPIPPARTRPVDADWPPWLKEARDRRRS